MVYFIMGAAWRWGEKGIIAACYSQDCIIDTDLDVESYIESNLTCVDSDAGARDSWGDDCSWY